MDRTEYLKIRRPLEGLIGLNGSCFGSKSGFRDLFPHDLIVFNANVCSATNKLWYGDLHFLPETLLNFVQAAQVLNTTLYVLREHEARFDFPDFKIEQAFVIKFSPQGEITLGPDAGGYELFGETIKELN